MDANDIFGRLAEPFPPAHLEWKPLGKPFQWNSSLHIKLLAYHNDDRIRDRLDDVLGPVNWSEHYSIGEKGVVCAIRLHIPDEDRADNILSREFASGIPLMDDPENAIKGACTYAFRACFGHAFCRYPWYLPESKVPLFEGWGEGDAVAGRVKDKQDKWWHYGAPSLPEWALPGGSGRPTDAPTQDGLALLKGPQGPPDFDPEIDQFLPLTDALRQSLLERAKRMFEQKRVSFDPKKVTKEMTIFVGDVLEASCGTRTWARFAKMVLTEDEEKVADIFRKLSENLNR